MTSRRTSPSILDKATLETNDSIYLKSNRPTDKVPRPMNAFMIFARENRQSLRKLHPCKMNKEISIKLGEKWTAMTAEEKDVYHGRAHELQQQHKKMYPTYSYRPVGRRRKIRKKGKGWASSLPGRRKESVASLKTFPQRRIKKDTTKGIRNQKSISKESGKVQGMAQTATDGLSETDSAKSSFRSDTDEEIDVVGLGTDESEGAAKECRKIPSNGKETRSNAPNPVNTLPESCFEDKNSHFTVYRSALGARCDEEQHPPLRSTCTVIPHSGHRCSNTPLQIKFRAPYFSPAILEGNSNHMGVNMAALSDYTSQRKLWQPCLAMPRYGSVSPSTRARTDPGMKSMIKAQDHGTKWASLGACEKALLRLTPWFPSWMYSHQGTSSWTTQLSYPSFIRATQQEATIEKRSQTALGVLVPDALVSEGEVTPSKCNGQLARDVHISDHERIDQAPDIPSSVTGLRGHNLGGGTQSTGLMDDKETVLWARDQAGEQAATCKSVITNHCFGTPRFSPDPTAASASRAFRVDHKDAALYRLRVNETSPFCSPRLKLAMGNTCPSSSRRGRLSGHASTAFRTHYPPPGSLHPATDPWVLASTPQPGLRMHNNASVQSKTNSTNNNVHGISRGNWDQAPEENVRSSSSSSNTTSVNEEMVAGSPKGRSSGRAHGKRSRGNTATEEYSEPKGATNDTDEQGKAVKSDTLEDVTDIQMEVNSESVGISSERNPSFPATDERVDVYTANSSVVSMPINMGNDDRDDPPTNKRDDSGNTVGDKLKGGVNSDDSRSVGRNSGNRLTETGDSSAWFSRKGESRSEPRAAHVRSTQLSEQCCPPSVTTTLTMESTPSFGTLDSRGVCEIGICPISRQTGKGSMAMDSLSDLSLSTDSTLSFGSDILPVPNTCGHTVRPIGHTLYGGIPPNIPWPQYTSSPTKRMRVYAPDMAREQSLFAKATNEIVPGCLSAFQHTHGFTFPDIGAEAYPNHGISASHIRRTSSGGTPPSLGSNLLVLPAAAQTDINTGQFGTSLPSLWHRTPSWYRTPMLQSAGQRSFGDIASLAQNVPRARTLPTSMPSGYGMRDLWLTNQSPFSANPRFYEHRSPGRPTSTLFQAIPYGSSTETVPGDPLRSPSSVSLDGFSQSSSGSSISTSLSASDPKLLLSGSSSSSLNASESNSASTLSGISLLSSSSSLDTNI